MTLGLRKEKKMVSRSDGYTLKKCGCGRRVTINFNGEALCPACYQRMLKILAMNEKQRVIKAV